MDMGFVMFDNRSRPDQLPRGTLANSSNGRMGLNGEWQVRKGIDSISSPLTTGTDALTLPFYLYANKTISSASRLNSIVTLDFAIAHDFVNNTLVSISNLTLSAGLTTSPNGNRTITVTSPTQVQFTMSGSQSGSYGVASSPFAGSPIIDDTSVNATYGSCLYSNPSNTSNAYIIIAGNPFAKAINLSDGTSTTIAYPAAVALDAQASMLQAFNKVFIFRDGKVALEWNGVLTGSPAFTLVQNGAYTTPLLVDDSNNTIIVNGYATVTSVAAHGFKVGDNLTIVSGDGIVTNGTTIFVASASTNEFSFYITANGASDPHTITSAIKTSGSGIVTITTLSENNYITGQHIKISGLNGTTTSPNGVWQITKTGTYTFTYDIGGSGGAITYSLSSATAIKTASFEFLKHQSVGLGFSFMPSPPWATYHQRRLWMPFKWTMTGTSGNPTITSRGIVDELIVSDILDSDTYDQVYNEYRFNAGQADYLVAAHAFSDDKLVVFNRESIHLVISSADVANSSIQLITNEVGCLARRSIQQVADNIIFLSDNGVYGTNFGDLYNLRGNGVPLSSSIDATIKRINMEYAQNAVSAYFDNRYYLAVPLDASQVNNTILVFNFLNKGWESIDSVADSRWDIKELFAGGTGVDRGLYAVSASGAVHRVDHRLDATDYVSVSIGGSAAGNPIVSSATTRMFNFGVIDKKKWNNYEIHLQSSTTNLSDASMSVSIENIDQDNISLGTISSKLGEQLAIDEDATIRGRIGNYRGYGLQFTFTPTAGRPRLRAVKVGGSTTSKATQSNK